MQLLSWFIGIATAPTHRLLQVFVSAPQTAATLTPIT